jgi:hypothetical protein
MYDIIYSILVHESPESYYDMICNLFYFNKDINIFVIVHCNNFMYEELSKKTIKNVILNPTHYDKTYFTYDIPQAHCENYMHCLNNNIKCRYFITYASNCMFHKKLTLEHIEKQFIEEPQYEPQKYYIENRIKGWVSNEYFLKNINIINLLKEHGMNEIYPCQHEGAVFESYIFKELTDFLIDNNIKSMIQHPYTSFEEHLIPSIYINIKKQRLINICTVFWNHIPSIEEIKNIYQPAVKRVERKYDSPVRIWLREITDSYEGIII